MNFDGFYLIDKQQEWTSFDVCARMRKLLNIKKIGHTGTLDPFATGLLVVAVGKCTRLIPFFEKDRKKYRTKILFGKSSPTLDPESDAEDAPVREVGESELQQILDEKFLGKIQQMPPQFSAIKIAGKKSCDLARRGEKVELKLRDTEIFIAKIVNFAWPEVEIELDVAAGFYVRALARDLGEALGGGAICAELRRTGVGELSVDDAELLEQISTPIDPAIILTEVPHREIPTGRVQDFIAGRAFEMSGLDGEKVLVLVGGRTIGMGEFCAGKLQPRVVL